MGAKSFLLRIFQNCNPSTYGDLQDEKLRSTYRTFFTHYLFFVILMSVLFVPAFFVHEPILEQRFTEFTNATFDAELTADHAIVLVDKPRILFDQNATTSAGGQVVLSHNGIFYKPFYWFGSAAIDPDTLRSLNTVDSSLLFFLAVLLWPALIFWSGLYILVKVVLFIILFTLLGWIIPGAFRQSLNLKRAHQVAIYAATPMLLVEMLLFPFWQNGWVMFAIYVVAAILGFSLLSERKMRSGARRKKGGKRDRRKGSRTDEIFS